MVLGKVVDAMNLIWRLNKFLDGFYAFNDENSIFFTILFLMQRFNKPDLRF